jgi:hypothetical protein
MCFLPCLYQLFIIRREDSVSKRQQIINDTSFLLIGIYFGAENAHRHNSEVDYSSNKVD